MERKLVSIQKVLALNPIEGADAIETATILGWSCVVKKGEFKINDFCCFFEIDSLIPFQPWSAFLFRNGREGTFRLKTIRLRGQISQGLALPISILKDYDEFCYGENDLSEGEDVSQILGIVKYEPQIPAQLQGICKSTFPSWIPKTDETRIQSDPWLLEAQAGKRIVIREKIDGCSMTVYLKDGEFGVCSRNMDLKEDENNSYWKIAKALCIETNLRLLKGCFVGREYAIQGELYGMGVQGNKYKLNELRFAVFNVFDIGHSIYLNDKEVIEFCNACGLEQCPLMNYDNLGGTFNNWVSLVSGMRSKINPEVQAEGIVVRGVNEEEIPRYGRFSFKVINPEFLLLHKE